MKFLDQKLFHRFVMIDRYMLTLTDASAYTVSTHTAFNKNRTNDSLKRYSNQYRNNASPKISTGYYSRYFFQIRYYSNLWRIHYFFGISHLPLLAGHLTDLSMKDSSFCHKLSYSKLSTYFRLYVMIRCVTADLPFSAKLSFYSRSYNVINTLSKRKL